jgi:glutamine amidotransferase
MVTIIDYGLGNIRSVQGALERIGVKVRISSDPQAVLEAERLLIPGVGAFGDGITRLRDLSLIEAIRQSATRVPILGICLGAQLLCKSSTEFGFNEGLSLIDATVERIDTDLRLPHIGWNSAVQEQSSPLFKDIPGDALFYYVHSYRISCANQSDVVASCNYGERFVSAFGRGDIFGVQFHPEKSQQHGLTLLRNFASLC